MVTRTGDHATRRRRHVHFYVGNALGWEYVFIAEGRVRSVSPTSITTRYAVEAQGVTAAERAALAEAQSEATLYRTGQLGRSMGAESQYWSLQDPLTPGYGGQMGMPGVVPDFMMGGSLSPGASVLTNTARGLGANAGGGIQVITSPGAVGIQWFVMP